MIHSMPVSDILELAGGIVAESKNVAAHDHKLRRRVRLRVVVIAILAALRLQRCGRNADCFGVVDSGGRYIRTHAHLQNPWGTV